MLSYGADLATVPVHPCTCHLPYLPHPSIFFCTGCWERFPVCQLFGERRKCRTCTAAANKEDESVSGLAVQRDV